MTTETSDLLVQICAHTRAETERRRGAVSIEAMRQKAAAQKPPRGFGRTLMDQVNISRARGADCILLIMAALTDNEARELEALARAIDLDVLAEVHDEAELDRALGLQTPLIGINNRNLKTLKIDLHTSIKLAPLVPPDKFLVAESGIRTAADVRQLV